MKTLALSLIAMLVLVPVELAIDHEGFWVGGVFGLWAAIFANVARWAVR